MPECPTCGTTLSTEQGMRQHHTKVHGEPLANRDCSGCGTAFYDPKAGREFCDDCNPNVGEHNGNWQDATETTSCERCGCTFEYYPSDKKGVYCPDCVEAADDFLGEHYADVHNIEKKTRCCEQCGDDFSVLPCHIRNEAARFCSQDCVAEWLSEMWGDGTAVYNGRWRVVRRTALERDDHECQYCGKDADAIGREPDIHHIRPVRTFHDAQDAHTLDNVVALCRSCHRYAEIGEIPVTEIRPPSASPDVGTNKVVDPE